MKAAITRTTSSTATACRSDESEARPRLNRSEDHAEHRPSKEHRHAHSRQHLQASDPPDADRLSDRPVNLLAGLRSDPRGRRLVGRMGTVAFYSTVGGMIGALCAAVPGFIDLLHYKGGAPSSDGSPPTQESAALMHLQMRRNLLDTLVSPRLPALDLIEQRRERREVVRAEECATGSSLGSSIRRIHVDPRCRQ